MQKDIATMKANSNAYNNSNADKTALHNANLTIANKYGWKYDSGTGAYYNQSGNRVY